LKLNCLEIYRLATLSEMSCQRMNFRRLVVGDELTGNRKIEKVGVTVYLGLKVEFKIVFRNLIKLVTMRPIQ
jgi:hypothetical protein